MIKQLLQHLDSLQVDLAAIDPAHDIEAADKVAEIASALRQAVVHARTRPYATAADSEVERQSNVA